MKAKYFFTAFFLIIGTLCLILAVVTADSQAEGSWKICGIGCVGCILSYLVAFIIDDPHRLYRIVAATLIVTAALFYRIIRRPCEFGRKAYQLKRRSGSYSELYLDVLDRYDSKRINDQIHYMSTHSAGGQY